MANNKTLIIDNDLRIITIPPGVTLLGVESEDDVERLHFRVPRMHNDIDLAVFVPRIHYMNAASQGDIAPVEEKTVTDDSISFYWRVRRKVTKYKGKVQFIVCLKKAAEDGTVLQEFNTYPAALPVLRGLEVTEAQPVEGFPDVLEQILLQLDGRVPNTRKINGHALSQDVNLTADDVGADPAGAAGTAVSDHNVATDAHNDLRLLIDGLARRLNAAGDAVAAKAPAIIQTVEGTALTLTDAAEQRLAGLHLFGRSVQNGTPTPDAPVDIESAENPTVMLYGKNLLPPYTEATEVQGIQIAHNADGSITLDGTATARAVLYFVRAEKKHVLCPGAYVISMGAVLPTGVSCVFEKYKGTEWQDVLVRVASGTAYGTATVDVATNIACYLDIKSGTVLDGLTLHPQLELSESATEYEQYKQPQTLALPYVLRGIPVASDGNYIDESGQAWLCDEIDLERGVYIQRVSEGRVEISSYGTLDNGLFFGYWNIPDKKYRVRNGLISNAARYVTSSKAAEGTVYENAMNVVFVGTADDNLQTIKAKYENTTLYYVLAEPIETPLTAAEIAAYKALLASSPTTAIINDADAYMRASYVVDTKTYINSRSGAAPGVTPEQIARAVAEYLKENPIDTGATLTIGTIELFADKWEGGEKLYSQIVEVPGATPYSQVDLTPSVEQLAIFHDKDLLFVTENENGVVTVYAIGQRPTNDYTIQVTIKEVST